MKTAQLFRDQLGLSQELMAQYLGVTRSQLAMYEAGKRELSTSALAKLAEIALFFGQKNVTEKEGRQLLEKQELEVKVFLTRHIKELEYKQIKAQRLLETIQKKHHQNLQLHSLALYLQKNKVIQAEVLLQQAIAGIEKNGLARQAKQMLKIESSKSQMVYSNILKEK